MLSKQFMLTKKAPGVREEKEIFGVFPIIKELNAGNIPYEMYVTEKSLSEIRRIHQNYSTMLTETRINLLEENCFHSWFPQSVHSIVGIFRSAKAVEPRKKIPVTLIVDKVIHEKVNKDLMRISKTYDCDNLYFTSSCHVPYESIEVKKQWEEIVALLPPNRTVIAIGTNQRIESKRYNPYKTDEVLGSSNSCPIKRDDMELLVELPRNVNFTSIPHCVILVSGIKGLSSAARKLVYENCGIAVETPINNSFRIQWYDMEKALEILKCVLESAQCDYQNRMRKSIV